VGGSLYLSSLTSIPQGFNPTVGGDLDLSSLTSIPQGFNPTVCGSLYTKNTNKRIGARVNTNFFWAKDKKRYAKIDGIFCQILSERKSKIGTRTYRIFSAKKVNRDGRFFIANKNDYYAHGDSVKAAVADVQFKVVAEKLKNSPIRKDTLFTVRHYRLLTGACDLGCRQFMDAHGLAYRVVDGKTIESKKIRADELLPLLEKSHAYGVDKFKQLIDF